MNSLKMAALLFVPALSLLACGGPDNVKACNDWKAAAKCGTSTAALDAVSCDAYKNTSCDISEYFKCLTPLYVCTGGMYDTAKLAMASTCASKAVCK
ncbi:MAG: hypothetical protein JNJ46_29320 [Myxococcales bacterium]|nr:hypothetical protein [Myxococcales bacterium]